MENIRFLVVIALLGYIIKRMATKAEVESALSKVEEVLTTEIDQIKEALAQIDQVPDSIVERLTALSKRISGIVADPETAAEA